MLNQLNCFLSFFSSRHDFFVLYFDRVRREWAGRKMYDTEIIRVTIIIILWGKSTDKTMPDKRKRVKCPFEMVNVQKHIHFEQLASRQLLKLFLAPGFFKFIFVFGCFFGRFFVSQMILFSLFFFGISVCISIRVQSKAALML